MADGRKRPGPPEDSSSSQTRQRFSLLNYPDTRRRNMKKAIAGVVVVLGMFLTPGRGCCRRIAQIYLAWVLSSVVFRDVRSCLLLYVTTSVTAGVGDGVLALWLGFQKSGNKRQSTNNPALDNNAGACHGNPGIRRGRKFTSSIRTALIICLFFSPRI